MNSGYRPPDDGQDQKESDDITLLKLRSELAAGYQDAKTHFLLELAQNADDAEAASLSVRLLESPDGIGPDLLIIRNTGKAFDRDGYKSIISAWRSKKSTGEIGRFGIGFKSVYLHASYADLLSSQWRYRMPSHPWPEDRPWPESDVPRKPGLPWGPNRYLTSEDWGQYSQFLDEDIKAAIESSSEIPNACFVLHLNPGAAADLKREFSTSVNLRPDLLLFLKCLREITISGFGDGEIRIAKEESFKALDGSVKCIEVSDTSCSMTQGGPAPAVITNFFRVYRPLAAEPKMRFRTAVAIRIEPLEPPDGTGPTVWKEIPDEPDSAGTDTRCLWSWFPTRELMPWGFRSHGDFHLNRTRESLDSGKDKNDEKYVHNGKIFEELADLAEHVLSSLQKGCKPIPSGWQKAAVECVKACHSLIWGYQPRGDTHDNHLTRKIKELIESAPLLSSSDPDTGVNTQKAIIPERRSWQSKEDQYSMLTTLATPGFLPTFIDKTKMLKGQLRAWAGRRWLSREWSRDEGVALDAWSALGVEVADNLNLAIHGRIEALSPSPEEDSPAWILWMGLLAEVGFDQKALDRLKTGLRFPCKRSSDGKLEYRPIWDEQLTKRLVFDPEGWEDVLALRVFVRTEDKVRAEPILAWARTSLGLMPPDPRELMIHLRLAGDDQISSTPIIFEGPTPSYAGRDFQDLLTSFTKGDKDFLKDRAFVPARNRDGGRGLRKPAECLLPPKDEDQTIQHGFELYARLTGSWVVSPDVAAVPMDLDIPVGENTLSPRELLGAWGANEALTPEWSKLEQWKVSTAWDKLRVSLPGLKGAPESVFEAKLLGLETACSQISTIESTQDRLALFKFLWKRLCQLASRQQEADPQKWRVDPLVRLLQRIYRKESHWHEVEGKGPVSILRNSKWIPNQHGQLLSPTETGPANLQWATAGLELNKNGKARLEALLCFQSSHIEIADRIVELEQKNALLEEELGRLKETLDPEGPHYLDVDPLALEPIPKDGPSLEDIDSATGVVFSLLGPGTRPFASQIVPGLSTGTPDHIAARYIVEFHRDGLLSSDVRDDGNRILRDVLIEAKFQKCDGDEDFLARVENVVQVRQRPPIPEDLNSHNWYPGRRWSRWVTNLLGLPPAFSGKETEPKQPAELVCPPPHPPGVLRSYQGYLAEETSSILLLMKKALIEIPTGAGKTRLAAEVALDRLSSAPGKAILWVAPGPELCEQAIVAIRELFTLRAITTRTFDSKTIVFRRWYEGNPKEEVLHSEGEGGTVVACTYQSLKNLGPGFLMDELTSHVQLMVLDEAHRATADSWQVPIRRLIEGGVPVLGLTATPSGETTALLGGAIPVPEFKGSALRTLIDSKVLSQPIRAEITYPPITSAKPELVQDESIEEQSGAQWRECLANSHDRQLAISEWINRHLDESPSNRVLLFGASVRDASGLTAILRQKGIEAVLVSTAKTIDPP